MRKLNKSSTGVKRWLDGDATEVKRGLPPPHPPYTQLSITLRNSSSVKMFNPESIQICQAVFKIQIEHYFVNDDKYVNEMMD